jgi:O-antigen ligase
VASSAIGAKALLDIADARDRVLLGLASLVGFGMALVAAIFAAPTIASIFGKDPSLTGRTTIWRVAVEAIHSRPILGYGPGGLFRNVYGQPTGRMNFEVGYGIGHAHNGVLNLWLELGIVGVAIFALILVELIVNTVRLTNHHPQAFRWIASLTVALVVMSISEPTFQQPYLMMFVIMLAAASRLNRTVVSGRTTRRLPRPSGDGTRSFGPIAPLQRAR